MLFCDECGEGNPDDTAFCARCGAAVGGQAGSAAGGQPSEAAPPEAGAEASESPAGLGEGPLGEQGGPEPPPPGVPQALPWTPPPPPGAGAPFQAGPPPPPYPGGPPPYAPVRSQQTDGLAVAALVLGIAGFFFCPLFGILAVIFGYIGKRNIRESGGRLGGDGFCLAGIILGFIQIGIMLFVAIVWVIVLIIAVSTSSAAVMPALACAALLAAA